LLFVTLLSDIMDLTYSRLYMRISFSLLHLFDSSTVQRVTLSLTF